MSVFGVALCFVAWLVSVFGGFGLSQEGIRQSVGLLLLIVSLCMWGAGLWMIAP